MSEQLKEIDWTKPVRTVEAPHTVPQLVEQVAVYMIRTEKELNPGCKIRWVGYVDQYGRKVNVSFGPQVIENVPEEPEYIPLRPGDRLIADDREYMLVQVGGWWSLMDMARGTPWKSLGFNHYRDFLLLPDFKQLLGGKAEEWTEIYQTVRRLD